MAIEGPIEFYHSSYKEKGSFSYCHHCNRAKSKLRLVLHEGVVTSWIQVECPSCNKTIWIAELTTNEDIHPKGHGERYIVEEKNKCRVCGKETNRWDCYCYSYDKAQRIHCVCSERCKNRLDRGGVKNGKRGGNVK